MIAHGPAGGKPAGHDLDWEVDQRRHGKIFFWETLFDQLERGRCIVCLPGDFCDKVEGEELLDIWVWYKETEENEKGMYIRLSLHIFHML